MRKLWESQVVTKDWLSLNINVLVNVIFLINNYFLYHGAIIYKLYIGFGQVKPENDCAIISLDIILLPRFNPGDDMFDIFKQLGFCIVLELVNYF